MLKTKKELRKMFFDNFLGTIADNLVEAFGGSNPSIPAKLRTRVRCID